MRVTMGGGEGRCAQKYCHVSGGRGSVRQEGHGVRAWCSGMVFGRAVRAWCSTPRATHPKTMVKQLVMTRAMRATTMEGYMGSGASRVVRAIVHI